MDDTTKYRDLFFEETDEYLQTLNECILELETHPEEKGLIDEIFRAAHTLKGMAATMGYKTMTELTHSMENVFELFKNGSLKITGDVITLIFTCLDKLSEIVEDLRMEIEKEYDIEDIIGKLEALATGEGEAVKKEEAGSFKTLPISGLDDTLTMLINSGRERDYEAYNIAIKLDETCTLKGARSYLVINRLEQNGDIIHLDPPAEKLEEGDFDRVFRLIFLSKLELEEVEANIKDNVEIEDTIVEVIDFLKAEAIEEETKNPPAIQETQELAQTESNTEIKKAKKEESKDSSSKSSHHSMNQSIRVDLSRLDRFMNLVSELVIYRTRLEDLSTKYKATEIYEPLENVERITSELQDLVLKIRMQPVNVVLNRFPRMIRDLSGASFETYANIRVRGAIIDELRKLGKVSRNRMDKLNSYYREKENLENTLMRTPTEVEICEQMNFEKKDLFEIHETVNDLSYISLESVLFPQDDGDFGVIDVLEDKDAPSPQDELMKEEQSILLTQAIGTLDEREKIILNLYYVEELTLKEIGHVLEISIPRVSQIHSKILLNLREKIEKLGAN